MSTTPRHALAGYTAVMAAVDAVDDAVDALEGVQRPCPGRHPLAARPTGQPVWCLGCEASITTALVAPARAPGVFGIADLLVKVAARRDGRLLTVAPAPARRGPGRSLPSASPGFDEIDEHARWAVDWAVAIATDLGRPPAVDETGMDDAHLPSLIHALHWLHAHARPALVGPRALAFGEDVLGTHRRLATLADERPLGRRLRVPCPACDSLGLYREDGTDRVQCLSCSAQWSETDFQTALSTQAS